MGLCLHRSSLDSNHTDPNSFAQSLRIFSACSLILNGLDNGVNSRPTRKATIAGLFWTSQTYSTMVVWLLGVVRNRTAIPRASFGSRAESPLDQHTARW